MFLIRKNYPNSDRVTWWDGNQWVACNYYAVEFKRSLSALNYAKSRPLRSDYSIVHVTKKDSLPVTVPLEERNGESNQRTPGEKTDA